MNLKKNSLFENIWLFSATVIVGVASILSSNDLLVVISSICGVIYAISIGYKDKFAYVWGFVNVVLYGIVLLLTKTYAGAFYNLIYSAPMMVYGFFSWKRMEKKGLIRTLSNRARIIISACLIPAIIGFSFVLEALGGTYVWLDSMTTCIGFVGIFLMTNLYVEQWWAWNISNTANLVLWIVRSTESISNLPLAIMWLIYLINSIYAFIKWNKMLKLQKEKLGQVSLKEGTGI